MNARAKPSAITSTILWARLYSSSLAISQAWQALRQDDEVVAVDNFVGRVLGKRGSARPGDVTERRGGVAHEAFGEHHAGVVADLDRVVGDEAAVHADHACGEERSPPVGQCPASAGVDDHRARSLDGEGDPELASRQ